MAPVRWLLDQKGHTVWTVAPDATVYEAIALMAEKNIGSLVVLENEKVVGIITERLYSRRIALKGKVSGKTKVRDIMETMFPFVDHKNSIDECMAIMTAESVRYLPVMDEGRLSGLVSMGDLVSAKVDDQQFQINELVNYFRGTRW